MHNCVYAVKKREDKRCLWVSLLQNRRQYKSNQSRIFFSSFSRLALSLRNRAPISARLEHVRHSELAVKSAATSVVLQKANGAVLTDLSDTSAFFTGVASTVGNIVISARTVESQLPLCSFSLFLSLVKTTILNYQSPTTGLFPVKTCSDCKEAKVRDSLYCAASAWALALAYRLVLDMHTSRLMKLVQKSVNFNVPFLDLAPVGGITYLW